MSVGEISSYLLADWVPSLPVAVSSSFMGWPPFLVEVVKLKGNDVLALHAAAGRSERQWKSVLSWMLGVAGARHVLKFEGYRWIAPLSAFYPGGVQTVDLSRWHSSFPRSSVIARRRPGSRSRLRPDYLALRSTASTQSGGAYEWAVTEAKGTQIPLKSAQTCPTDWSNQARNVVVTVNDLEIDIPRHLVVATRVNPNAARLSARHLQLRAWNRSNESKQHTLPPVGAVDIAAAHLFGLFRSLRLPENALAIALSVQARTELREGRLSMLTTEQAERASNLAEHELLEQGRKEPRREGDFTTTALTPFLTERGPVLIDLAEPVITLARKLSRANNEEVAVAALREADSALDTWEASLREAGNEVGRTILPFGVEVRSPRDFEPHE